MGYTLGIGELKTYTSDDELEGSVFNTSELKRLENAPAYGEPTDKTNQRWPSYTAWHNFAEFVNLEDFFYDKNTGLIRQHPGCVPLSQKHKEIIDKAYSDFYIKYPNVKPGYSPKIDESNSNLLEDPEWPKENNYAVRLEWLKFWVDWALINCKNPVFSNS